MRSAQPTASRTDEARARSFGANSRLRPNLRRTADVQLSVPLRTRRERPFGDRLVRRDPRSAPSRALLAPGQILSLDTTQGPPTALVEPFRSATLHLSMTDAMRRRGQRVPCCEYVTVLQRVRATRLSSGEPNSTDRASRRRFCRFLRCWQG
jgi:hypothetical protein